MRLFFLFLLFCVFGLTSANAEEKYKRLLNPTDPIKLGVGGKFITVPYAYLRIVSNVILKREGIVDLHQSPFASVNIQYLYPSLAPPPEICDFEKVTCDAAPVAGFEPAPKGQEQIFVIYDIEKTFSTKMLKEKIDTTFSGYFSERRRKEGIIKDFPDLGLTRSLISSTGVSDYIPIKALDLFTYIICFNQLCNIFQLDFEADMTHRILIHRKHLADWRGYIASRKKILKKFPLE